jgi:DtxR family Mn-dependent transcriptional regulator
MEIWKEFEANDITHSAAHHLLAILELREKRGYARVTDVAKELEITTGSASINLKALKAKNLIVEDENKFLSLSPQGEAIARAVHMRKNILHEFLVKILKVSAEQAEIDSCKTEHLISAETAQKLQEFTDAYLKTTVRA